MSVFCYGIDVQYFIKGWWGEHGEGESLLQTLALPSIAIPFRVKSLLENETVTFKDGADQEITVWFNKHDTHFEFNCSYMGKQRHIRLYREWETETLDDIIRFESYSIGECVRKIIMGESVV